MQPARTIHAYPDTAGRDWPICIRIPLSMALLSAGLASLSLSPALAQTAAPAPPDERRLARRHQAARAGTRSRARPAEERGRGAGKAQGRHRGDRPGSQQAQPAADRHRRAGAWRRDQDRRCRSAATPTGCPRAANPQLARIRAASEIVEVLAALQRAGRRTPPALLVRPEDALTVAAHRDAARLGGAGTAGARRETRPATSANS